MKRITALLLALVLALTALSGCAPRQVPLSERIPNNEAVVAAVRKGLREHARSLTLRFRYDRDILEELTALTDEWMERALAETEDPAEGDYIRYQLGGYTSTSRCVRDGDAYACTVEITPRYYSYLVEEEEVTARLEEVMAGFGFDGETTELEKVTAIYDYVCRTVRYDHVHAGRPTATKRSTAYSALIWHTATCQGYSVLLYRLLRMAGLKARVITGSAGEDSLHAWNLVELEGQYYQLDATWDAGKESYTCFLKGAAGLPDHVPDPQFQTQAFRSVYPPARSDYYL